MTITRRSAPCSGAPSLAARRGQPFLICLLAFFAVARSWAGTLPTASYDGDLSGANQYIVGGPAPDSPAAHVDANVPTSPFAGVVSISVFVPGPGGFIGSGVLLDSTHVLTAAHVVDVVGGDGIPDPTLSNVTVVFNQNNPGSNLAGADLRGISNIAVHPDYHPNILGPLNDDLCILTLSSPAPVGVPSYSLSNNPFNFVQDIAMVGYGLAGDGVAGFTTGTSFFVKRVGENLASFYVSDDEGTGSKELFLFDFDGPTLATDSLGDGGTFGNAIESTLGGGDSGGPAFLWNDTNLDNIVDPSELEVFGIDTFGFNSTGFGPGGAPPPFFGSWGGGVLVSTYVPWIESAVPEPSTIALLIAGTLGVGALVRNGRRRPA
jgi:hypothetical protein